MEQLMKRMTIKAELVDGLVRTGMCGVCEFCCGFGGGELECAYDEVVPGTHAGRVAEALKGSGWALMDTRQTGVSAFVQLARSAARGPHGWPLSETVMIKGGILPEHAPWEVKDALLAPIPCPARASGCEGVLLASHNQCPACGTWRD